MEVRFEKPPVFDRCVEKFGVKETDPIFYTYGDVCYSPAGITPSADLIAHEETHAEQQGHDKTAAKLWWEMYFADPEFRAAQEAEAYGMQFRFLKGRYHDRNAQARILHQLAGFLSSDTYGKCVSHSDAMHMIKAYADGTALNGIEQQINDNEQ